MLPESPTLKPYVTKEEYLFWEEQAEYKSEYYSGKVVSMAGGTLAHNTLTLNAIGLIGNALHGRTCQVFGMDVKVELAESYAYPDVFVLCEPPEFAETGSNIVKNPSLIMEVLSASTEADDRGRKFQLYRKLPSFKEYVLVSQTEHLVETFSKVSESEWRISTYFNENDIIVLHSLGIEMPMKDLYSKVSFAS